MKTKRLASLLLTSLLIVALLVVSVACTNKSSSEETTSGSTKLPSDTEQTVESPLSKPGELPIAKDTTPLSILMEANTLVEDYDTNEFTEMIEKTCNVEIQFHFLPATNPGDKLAIMISAGENLPDVVNFNLSEINVYKYAQAGAFIPLNDYYDTVSVNVVKFANEYPQFSLLESITSPDGNIYAIPKFNKYYHNEVPFKYWINKHWLDTLGLEMPTTTQEFYEVLKAFKTQDPNRNNVADEIALIGGTGNYQDVTKFLMNAFTFEGTKDLFTVIDGRVSTSYLQPEWREGLRYMHQLVSEGLLDPLSFTQDDSQLRALVNNTDICLVGTFAFTSNTLMNVASNPYLDQYVGLSPLKGPKGVRLASYTEISPSLQWFVTKDCNNPELAFRVGDFLFDEDIYMLGRYGKKGVNWEPAKPGDVSRFASMGFEPVFLELENVWSISQNRHWRGEYPALSFKVVHGSVAPPEPDHYLNRISNAVAEYYACKPAKGTYVPKLIFNEDELLSISEIQATLISYVNESKIRFITGDLDIDRDWDSFQNELKAIGIEKFLDVCQKVYDRMYK